MAIPVIIDAQFHMCNFCVRDYRDIQRYGELAYRWKLHALMEENYT